MYYVILGCGCSEDEDETTQFETKEAAVKSWVAQANAIINEIVRRGYRPDVLIGETLFRYELTFVALSMPKNKIMDTYFLALTKD